MKKKILSLILALLLVCTCAVPAAAAYIPCRYPLLYLLRCCVCCPQISETPSVPEVPAEPVIPDVPAEPETPDIPAEPAQPAVPVHPAEPEEPARPIAPALPDGVLAAEAEVVRLVNERRAEYGLAALTLDADLCEKARIKSQDLHDARYFDHNSPTYGSPFDMMRSFGIRYAYAGENIAKGYYTPEDVVQAWMDSPSHRDNLLSANYTRLGVGYVEAGGYWTQWFIG